MGPGHDTTTRPGFFVVALVVGFTAQKQSVICIHDTTTRKTRLLHVRVRMHARVCARAIGGENICRGVVEIHKYLSAKEKSHDKRHDEVKLNVVVQFKSLKSQAKTHDSAKKGGF